MHSYIMANDIPSEYDGTAPALKELYRVRTVQCLLIADITKPVCLSFFPSIQNIRLQ